MRLISLFRRCAGNIIVASAIVATVKSTARAQPLVDPRCEIASGVAATPGKEPPAAAAHSFPDLAATVEATPEAAAPPFGGPILERSRLTGDWSGWRAPLRDDGVTLDVSTTQYYQGVTTGGLQQAFQYGGRNDYFLNLDGEKLGLWKGASVALHGETRYGESVNTLAGTLMAPNLMLAVPLSSGSITALTGVTFTQSLSEEMMVYAGKLNTLDSTGQPLTGANSRSGFQNTAMIYNPVYARTIPYSTFGAGFAYLKGEEYLFEVTVYDSNNTPTVSGFNTFFNNGATVYAQVNLPTTFFDRPGHQGISGTYGSGTYSDLSPSAYLDPIVGLAIQPKEKTGSWCATYNFDQALYVSPENPQRMWGVFSNLGIADNNPSPGRWFANAGISGASPIERRKADTFGAAYFYLGVSDTLKSLAPLLLPLRNEQGIELYYNMAVTPWCQVTPDLQVISPFRERADTSLIVGMRAKIDF